MYSSSTIWVIGFLMILSIPPSLWTIQIVNAVLYENGTCTNESFTRHYNTTLNINGTVDDFLKSLPSDNMILAEIVCNETIEK